MSKKKYCMLEDNKLCDNCCECDKCDLDPEKICDNCAKCINTNADYKVIEIEDLLFLEEEINKRINHKKMKVCLKANLI